MYRTQIMTKNTLVLVMMHEKNKEINDKDVQDAANEATKIWKRLLSAFKKRRLMDTIHVSLLIWEKIL